MAKSQPYKVTREHAKKLRAKLTLPSEPDRVRNILTKKTDVTETWRNWLKANPPPPDVKVQQLAPIEAADLVELASATARAPRRVK